MAGHSKWANIKHRKAAQDAKRAKVFTPLIRDLMVAARQGGGNPNDNASLRMVLEKAKGVNMPKDVIERAIKRGTGEIEGADYVERTYEGYGAGGVAVMVKTLTDNPTRTFTSVRTAFGKQGGNVGTDGSVAWMFKEEGVIWYKPEVADADAMLEAAIEAGADDVESTDEGHKISCNKDDFGLVRDALEQDFGTAEEADITFTPVQLQPVDDAETAAKVMKLIELLEEDNDVQEAIPNADFAEGVLEGL